MMIDTLGLKSTKTAIATREGTQIREPMKEYCILEMKEYGLLEKHLYHGHDSGRRFYSSDILFPC